MPDPGNPPDLFEVIRVLATALDGAGIEYAIGGALALGIWAEPRGTRDIDLALYHDRARVTELFELFERAGSVIERDTCRWRLDTSGYFEFELHGIRVDVFVADCILYERARPRRVQVDLGGGPVSFWSAEDLILFKLLFFRGKDKVDIESILAVRGNRLDLAYVRTSLRETLRDEERTRWFEDAVKASLA